MKLENICVQSTLDYDKIKKIPGNRMVNPRNVEIISQSMNEKHLCVPAILNEHMELIDGQHRFESCVKLNLPFYYIVVEGYNLKDVQRINSHMKNWTLYDFLNTYLDLFKMGHTEYEDYAKLKVFMDDYGFPLPTALAITNFKIGQQLAKEQFKIGNFRFDDENGARVFSDELMNMFSPIDEGKWKNASFVKCFSELYHYDGYNHAWMAKNVYRLTAGDVAFGKLSGIPSFRNALVEAYNHRLARKDRISAISLENSYLDFIASE